jgi:hypothetical protein
MSTIRGAAHTAASVSHNDIDDPHNDNPVKLKGVVRQKHPLPGLASLLLCVKVHNNIFMERNLTCFSEENDRRERCC